MDPNNIESIIRGQIRDKSPDLNPNIDEKILALSKGGNSQNPQNLARVVWPVWLVWTASAAALIFVLYSFNKGGGWPFGKTPNKHFADSLDLSKCRYVGKIGDAGILELEGVKEGNQRRVFEKSEIDGYIVLAIDENFIELEGRDKKRYIMKLKGLGVALKNDLPADPDKKVSPFTIKGIVTREDGKTPADQAFILAYNAKGRVLQSAKTDTAGKYSLVFDKPIDHLRVGHWSTAIQITREGGWRKDAEEDFRMKDDRNTFTLRGTVTDSAGKPIANLLVQAFHGKGIPCSSVYTDKDGKYSLRDNQEITALRTVVENIQLQKRGEWRSDSEVNFSGDAREIFEIKGQVTVLQGQSIQYGFWKMEAWDEDGLLAAASYVNTKGEYLLRVNRPVRLLLTHATNRLDRFNNYPVDGLIKGAKTQDLRLEDYKPYTLEGRVLNESGSPISDRRVYFIHVDDKGLESLSCMCTTDKDGNFKACIASGTVEKVTCYAYPEIKEANPWATATGLWKESAKNIQVLPLPSK